MLARRALPRAGPRREIRRDGGERRFPLAAMVHHVQGASRHVADVDAQSQIRLRRPDGPNTVQRAAAGLHIVYLLRHIGGSQHEGRVGNQLTGFIS